MIIVTGANGRLGGGTVEHLLKRLPADQIGVSVRDPERAKGLSDRGVRVRHGDFTDASSLEHAFEGASRVLIVSCDTLGEEGVRQHRTAIDAAVGAGARRILYTSHMAASADSSFVPVRDHTATEEYLAATGVPFTSLRDGFHASSAPMMLGDTAEGTLAIPADGPVAWTDVNDLAEAAAILLAGEAVFEGPTPPLTAEATYTLPEVAAMAAGDRPVATERLSDDDYRSRMKERGLPDIAVEMMLGFFLAARAGEFAGTDPALARLLGRSPRPLPEVLPELLGRPAPQWH
ncbi:NmrA family NAD(P)-binding protein [Glycomyces arizonensis]|uniref:NmrA family NAD(P)-binding protein n=1 Tax=Glycomyces arizonensis TaxID=256035 RepID=UPI0003FAFDD9|nr:NAD(P)H-binding protein [Glycomyces arizonensis]